MKPSLDTWPRQYYSPGGGDALLFYVVYGPTPQEFSISASKYRCDGIPEGVDVSIGGESDLETVETFRSGYLWDQLQETNPTLANEIAKQSECLIIQGTVSDPADLNYLRNVVGVVSWCFDNNSVAVFDPQMFKWWSPTEWRTALFEPAAAVPRHHVTILISAEEDGTEWFHTRGMRKFGRPDLSVHHVSPDLRDGIVDLFNRFIEFQAFGGIIAEGQEIRMASLPPGMICTHQGDLEDPDFNNVHVEISHR